MTQYLPYKQRHIPVDSEGYLKNLQDWEPQVAEVLAQQENLELTEAHWEIINLLRDFHRQHALSPPMRVLVNLVKRELGAEKGRSMYVMKLFPGSPAKLASKLAGLPKPSNCL